MDVILMGGMILNESSIISVFDKKKKYYSVDGSYKLLGKMRDITER